MGMTFYPSHTARLPGDVPSPRFGSPSVTFYAESRDFGRYQHVRCEYLPTGGEGRRFTAERDVFPDFLMLDERRAKWQAAHHETFREVTDLVDEFNRLTLPVNND